ncbi:MAG TPA: hypothetical protein DD708_03375 [Deltaproteobacteria bacterium]|nr:hypothetical protein [Deltaproteobacteria bacterium]
MTKNLSFYSFCLLKLKLHEIKEPLSFSFSEENGWLKAVFTHLKLSFQGPVSIGLEITKDKDIIFFQGHLKVSLTLPCSRCVENMAYEIDEFFSPVFAHGKDPHREKAELSLEDLDITYFDKDEIDVGEIIEEQVGLLLPLKPLCSERCQGLCSACGQNLNEKRCSCKKEVPVSPFHVLKGFKVTGTKKIKKKRS